jgi:hypothetical protein
MHERSGALADTSTAGGSFSCSGLLAAVGQGESWSVMFEFCCGAIESQCGANSLVEMIVSCKHRNLRYRVINTTKHELRLFAVITSRLTYSPLPYTETHRAAAPRGEWSLHCVQGPLPLPDRAKPHACALQNNLRATLLPFSPIKSTTETLNAPHQPNPLSTFPGLVATHPHPPRQ